MKKLNKAAEIKKAHLTELAAYRRQLYRKPILKFLFFELTLRCNEHCWHCGSSCGDVPSEEMTTEQYKKLLEDIKRDFDVNSFQLCITGGEPLLRKDFYEIMSYAHELGFHWGMTSNAVLIDAEAAKKLKACGMDTISVSIDGLRETHDKLRGLKGSYDRAMAGINALINEGGFQHIQVTTVLNHETMKELDGLYEVMKGIDIDSWRVIGVEPIGRALSRPELLMTMEDQRELFSFIRRCREVDDMPVTYGCSHYLGLELEREVRQYYFICNAGIYSAGIMTNGDVGACLDIERRPETIQGNIFKTSLKEIWDNGFAIFRQDLDKLSEKCSGCSSAEFCAGGARHSWDYDKNEQRVCFAGQKGFFER